MNNKFQGKRAELGMYDDDEFIVPSPKIMHDNGTSEKHRELLDKINKIIEQNPVDELKRYGDLIG